MSQNIDELWESLVLEKFPSTPKHKIQEAKWQAAMSWGMGDETVMSQLYDKFVMMKRLKGIEPKKEE